MKLFHKIMLRISVASIVIMAAWSVFFYYAIMDEVNDELDDMLENYAERLMLKVLNGEEMPSAHSGSNNQYYIYDVTEEYATTHNNISYRDEMVYIEDKLDNEPARVLVTIFRTDTGYKELVVYTPAIDKIDFRKAILYWVVALYVAIIVTLIVLNVLVFRRNMKPLYTLLSWFNGYKIGHHYKPLPNTSSITEFRNLYDAVNMSVMRNEELYEQQKMFIGNASHEMQTPLAVACNRIEMMLEDETLGEKHMEEAARVLETLERLSRINKSLLMLCKIENGQYSDMKEISFEDLFLNQISVFGEMYGYKKLTISTAFMSDFRFCINESLASMLVSNMLKNACIHNMERGRVKVSVSSDGFSVSNTGDTPLDSTKVFQRFYQGSKKEGSTGLGLALCDTICRSCGLSIEYEYLDGMHIFSVSKVKNRYK